MSTQKACREWRRRDRSRGGHKGHGVSLVAFSAPVGSGS